MITVTAKVGKNQLEIRGRYTKTERNVGLQQSFTIFEVTHSSGSLVDLLEWAGSQGSSVLEALEEVCLRKIDDE